MPGKNPKRIVASKKAPAQKPKSGATAVSNQVKIDSKNPIPFDHTGTAFRYVNDQAYLPYLPPKDSYARDILETRLLSVTHNACVNTKSSYCAGTGFQDKKATAIPQPILDWFNSMNLKNQGVMKINKKIFEDFFTWGNVPIEVVRFKVGGQHKLFVYAHSFLEWRLCPPDENDVITHAVQSKLFLRNNVAYLTQKDLSKSKKLPIYNPQRPEKENWFTDEKGVQRTLIWFMNSCSGFPYYGVPSAISSMINQLLEYKGDRYELDNFENNMVAAAILALKGNVSDKEANKIAKGIVDTYTGDGKRGRTIVVSSEQGIESSDYHQIDTQKEGSYNEAADKWSQKIILANEWDAILAGLINPSTLGKGAGFLTKIYEIKLKNVIKPAQAKIYDDVWSHIFKIAEEWLKLKFSDLDLEIKNSLDISGLTDVDIAPAVTKDEVREAKGLPKAKKGGGEYMKSSGSNKSGKPKEKEDDDV